MYRLTGLGIRNLRCLRDTGVVDIKPITVLVGKNSAGKSTFARILPLLKQSAERRKQAPLLWFGRLVDFGSFGEALSSFADQKEIELKLKFEVSEPIFLGPRVGIMDAFENVGVSDIEVRMSVGGSTDDDRTILRSVTLIAFGIEIKLFWDSARSVQVTVDGANAAMPNDASMVLLSGAIIPQPHLIYREAVPSVAVSDSEYFKPTNRSKLGTMEIRHAITHFVHGNTLPERKDEIADRLPLASAHVLMNYCKNLSAAPDTWRSSLQYVDAEASTYFTQLRRALLLYKLEPLLVKLDDAVNAFCTGVSYLEPLRATAQRYYRREEVSIDELDPKGLNTTFFIQGLTPRDRESLNSWLKAAFGFTLSVKNAGGHASLTIDTGTGQVSRNMADVGLGYSQIAPVAIQLWAARQRISGRLGALQRSRNARRKDIDTRSVVVIEQPELHLHPAYQAKLADVFATIVESGTELSDDSLPGAASKIQLVIETHSANLINRLGELVGEGKLKSESVQVLVFEPETGDSAAAAIRVATFDERGILKNWPIGFFDY